VTTPSEAAAPGAPNAFASRLAYAGLVPFVIAAALAWLVREDAHFYVVDALSKYAALVISFLGGIHWGLGMRQSVPSPSPFGWAVVPVLLAWIGALMPAYAGLPLLGALLIVCYLVDRRAYRAHGVATWLTLRFRLSFIAAFCCFLAAAST
jgi:hypothetical protein